MYNKDMKIYDPTRAKYNSRERKAKKTCFFCDEEVVKSQECTKFRFKYWNVLVNKHPYLDGNVMLVPKRHSTTTEKISKDEWEEFPRVLNEVQKILGKMFCTKSFNVGINLGKDSGRSVPHLHWQVIPRRRKNYTVTSVLADIQVITMSAEELRKKLSK